MMGMIFFLILAGLEIGLGVWTLAKQKERILWKRNRLAVSGIQWGLIALILLLPVGNKGLRFAGCFVILSIRLIIAGVRFLLRNRSKKQGASRTGRTIAATLLACILLWISLIPAYVFTGYEGLPTTGKHKVGMVSAILTDKSRLEEFEQDGSYREVPIYVYYPEAPTEKAPIVFFSHGAFGYYQSNSSTYMELASHGYVVISMDHPYHSFFTKDTEGKTILVNPEFIQSALRIGNAEDGDIPEEEIFQTTREWMKLRMDDMSFVIDEVRRQGAANTSNFGPAWYVKSDADAQTLKKVLSCVDVDKIGLMGHSLGGATSVTVGRQKSDVVDLVIDLDGTMLGEQLSYEKGEYQYPAEAYPVPLLAVNNEHHQMELEKYGALYVNGAVLANAKDAGYTYFEGSGHMNFTDLPLFSPFLASMLGTGSIDAKQCVEDMNDIILHFCDRHLKEAGAAQAQK
ncbi:MAG: hypothetical protein IKH28_00850 [Lachnospiraceae bacterium]|nr:hypothetical protein [Lachnospiraceae bacterium]